MNDALLRSREFTVESRFTAADYYIYHVQSEYQGQQQRVIRPKKHAQKIHNCYRSQSLLEWARISCDGGKIKGFTNEIETRVSIPLQKKHVRQQNAFSGR